MNAIELGFNFCRVAIRDGCILWVLFSSTKSYYQIRIPFAISRGVFCWQNVTELRKTAGFSCLSSLSVVSEKINSSFHSTPKLEEPSILVALLTPVQRQSRLKVTRNTVWVEWCTKAQPVCRSFSPEPKYESERWHLWQRPEPGWASQAHLL